jgi:hypothetical protein
MQTMRTGENAHVLCYHHQKQDGQIRDGPTFCDLPCPHVPRPMTRLIPAGPMDDHLPGFLHHLQHVSAVTCVPSLDVVAGDTYPPVACEAIT